MVQVQQEVLTPRENAWGKSLAGKEGKRVARNTVRVSAVVGWGCVRTCFCTWWMDGEKMKCLPAYLMQQAMNVISSDRDQVLEW